MSNFLEKYVGKYRVMAEYDRQTNDWIRDEYGNYSKEFNDFYIPLQRKYGKILYYDKDILIIDIESVRKGLDILRKMENDIPNFKKMIQKKVETDEEILIYIKDKDLEIFVPYINPSYYGAKIEPFDTKNLPKMVKIPKSQLKKVNLLQQEVGQKGGYKWADLTRQFILNNLNMNAKQIKDSKMSYYGIIYENKLWEKYLDFLQKKC